jgi:hypothetical protein
MRNRKEAPSYQDLVKEEKSDLEKKVFKLQIFVEKDEKFKWLDGYVCKDLVNQLSVMEDYLEILTRRVRRFDY